MPHLHATYPPFTQNFVVLLFHFLRWIFLLYEPNFSNIAPSRRIAVLPQRIIGILDTVFLSKLLEAI